LFTFLLLEFVAAPRLAVSLRAMVHIAILVEIVIMGTETMVIVMVVLLLAVVTIRVPVA
jgi:hypothetical protein